MSATSSSAVPMKTYYYATYNIPKFLHELGVRLPVTLELDTAGDTPLSSTTKSEGEVN